MREALNWKAAIIAGLVAGVAFIMIEMILVATVGGQSPWGPPRMMAAMVMGEGVLPPLATFDMGIMMVAMMIHFVLSIILGAVLGWIISHWRMGAMAAIAIGTIFGLVVYFVNFYGMTAVFPWFAMARGGISIFAHAMFGLVLGWIYHAIAKPSSDEARRTSAAH